MYCLQAAFKRAGVALQIHAAGGNELRQRHVHALGLLQHLEEQRLADREVVGGAGTFALQPGLQFGHRFRGGIIRLLELRLELGVLDRGERLRHVRLEEIGVAAETRDAALDEALRQRRAQIGADIRSQFGNGTRVADVAFEPLLQRCVVSRQVHLRIEATDVPAGVLERKLRALQPEDGAVDLPDQVVALEALLRAERAVGVLLGFGARLLQALDFLRDAGAAPVRGLAVELVAACVHGEERLRAQGVLDVGVGEIAPRLRRGGRRGRCRRGCGFAAAGRRKREKHKQQTGCKAAGHGRDSSLRKPAIEHGSGLRIKAGKRVFGTVRRDSLELRGQALLACPGARSVPGGCESVAMLFQ